jgi:hypothetical protein
MRPAWSGLPPTAAEVLVGGLNGTTLIGRLDVTTDVAVLLKDRLNLQAHAMDDREEISQPTLVPTRLGLKRANAYAGRFLCRMQFFLDLRIGHSRRPMSSASRRFGLRRPWSRRPGSTPTSPLASSRVRVGEPSASSAGSCRRSRSSFSSRSGRLRSSAPRTRPRSSPHPPARERRVRGPIDGIDAAARWASHVAGVNGNGPEPGLQFGFQPS